MSEHTRQWFLEAFKDLTDDDRIAENKRRYEVKQRLHEKRTDTGLSDTD